MGKTSKKLLIIGISGVTCGGKTTISTKLVNIFPNSKVFSQDDYFLLEDDPRQVWIPELNHINFDVLTSLDMEKMKRDIEDFIQSNEFNTNIDTINCKFQSTNDIQKYIQEKLKSLNFFVLIIEGFSIFNYKPMQNIFDLKYYFILNKVECQKRRSTRVYDPPDCPGYFEKCVWPEFLKQLEDVKKTVENVSYMDENSKNVVENILNDIALYLDQHKY